MNIQSKINKLIKALNINGYIYLLNREQFVDNKIENLCTVYKLFYLVGVEEYSEMYPYNEKWPDKYSKVKVELLRIFKQQEILLKLVKVYKEVGGADG